MAEDYCILEDIKKCIKCGECNTCDLNRKKTCDNCMECIFDVQSRFIKIDEIKRKKE